MADSKKSTVVIASVLKPVDDSRMYEKIGLTLAGSGKYDVHIIGCESARIKNEFLTQHSFRPFGRMSLRRFFAPWKIFLMARKARPDIFMIGTHELLYAALMLKMLTGCRIIYDVRENYYWNILYTTAFPLLLRPFVAFYVRGKEMLSARFVDHFLLAEKGYEQELKFPGNRYTVIENKVNLHCVDRETPDFSLPGRNMNLIFSGTIAETTGVFTAIDLAVKLHVIDDRIRLTIIGFCSQHRVLEKIRLLIRPRPFITLIARDSPIPHGEIFDHIRKSDFGLVTYQINPSTMNSIPTKVYEYLGFKLPILLVNHRPWVDFCAPYSASVVFDANHFDAGQIYREMTERAFYRSDPSAVYWKAEEPALLKAIAGVLG